MANMAGRRDILERTRFPQDGSRASSSSEESVGDSLHRITDSERTATDIDTERNSVAARTPKVKTRWDLVKGDRENLTNFCDFDNCPLIKSEGGRLHLMQCHLTQDEEVGNSNSTTHVFNSRTQVNATDPANVWHQEMHQPFTTRYESDPTSQGHEVQRAASRDQYQNLPVRAPSQDLPGLVPPREIDTRPPDSEATDGGQNYRRMAVCQETDHAQFQRTKMRVYMKRF